MIRLVGMLAVISCCSALGVEKSLGLKRRRRDLEALRHMLFDIETALQYNCASTAEIVRMLKAGGRMKFFLQLDYTDLRGSLERSEEYRSLYINDPERQIIADVFDDLGSSDLETQIAMIKFNKHRIETAIADCEKECAEKCRLYNSLGFFGGIFISLLII